MSDLNNNIKGELKKKEKHVKDDQLTRLSREVLPQLHVPKSHFWGGHQSKVAQTKSSSILPIEVVPFMKTFPSMIVPTPDVLCGATGEPCLTQYNQKHKQNSRNRVVAIPHIRIFCADFVPIFFLTASASTVPLRNIEILIGCGWKNCNSFCLREREGERKICWEWKSIPLMKDENM